MAVKKSTEISSKTSKRKSKNADGEISNAPVEHPREAENNATPVAIASADAEGGEKKRKKKRKADAVDDAQAESKKKKRKRAETKEEDAPEVQGGESENRDVEMNGASESKEKKNKKTRKDEQKDKVLLTAGDDVDPDDISSRKKEKQSKPSEEQAANTSGVPSSKKKKGGKKSKDKSKEVTDSDSRRKKKRKTKRLAEDDPEGDEALSEQARKAFSYAYIYATNRSEWKFNKARQNWLVRNVWSDQSIPGKYLVTVNKYLQSIQGGVRENLIKTCHEALSDGASLSGSQPEDPGDQTTAPQSEGDKTNQPEPKPDDVTKRTRASTLLGLLTGTSDNSSL